MNKDHAFLDKLWEDFFLSKKIDEASHTLLEKFYKELERHIRLENTFLFPRFNEYLGFGQNEGPIPVLLRDHQNIMRLLTRLEKVLQTDNFHDAQLISRNFQKLMVKHRKRENEMGYPVYDSFVKKEDWEDILLGIGG